MFSASASDNGRVIIHSALLVDVGLVDDGSAFVCAKDGGVGKETSDNKTATKEQGRKNFAVILESRFFNSQLDYQFGHIVGPVFICVQTTEPIFSPTLFPFDPRD
jgi:hypothetical protein